MLMVVEVDVSFLWIGSEDMDTHVGVSGAVAEFSDVMLEAEPRTAIQRAFL